jgi:ABC-2 type transport system ATP-binding protein
MAAARAREAGADDPVIDTHGLAKRYGRTDALVDLTLRVEPGEIFGFLGPNGAGKTTAVKLLLGLARASGGGGTVLGSPLGDRRARREIGYLPELFRYQPWLRAREVVELHGRLRSVDGGGAVSPEDIDAVLSTVDLADRAGDQVGGFSKGMQQRLGLAVALLGAPRLVILDEPTSALDPVGRADVRTIVRRAADAGSTIFLNSHLLTEVERVCDRVAIIDRGELLAEGRPDELARPHGVEVETDGGTQQFEGATREEVPAIVERLVAAGERIYEVRLVRSTLEDAYLAVVEHEPA